jgi:hypothetical protein
MRIRLAALLVPLALAACGGSTPPPPPPEASQVRTLATGIARSAEEYAVRAAATESGSECRVDRNGYEARVGPAIEGIRAAAGRLDEWLRARGPTEHADLECAAAALATELQRHTDIACTALDPSVNRAEATAHLLLVGRWTDLVLARVAEGAHARREGGPRCVRFADGATMYMP